MPRTRQGQERQQAALEHAARYAWKTATNDVSCILVSIVLTVVSYSNFTVARSSSGSKETSLIRRVDF